MLRGLLHLLALRQVLRLSRQLIPKDAQQLLEEATAWAGWSFEPRVGGSLGREYDHQLLLRARLALAVLLLPQRIEELRAEVAEGQRILPRYCEELRRAEAAIMAEDRGTAARAALVEILSSLSPSVSCSPSPTLHGYIRRGSRSQL